MCICFGRYPPGKSGIQSTKLGMLFQTSLLSQEALLKTDISVIFQIILDKPNCSWDQHPTSNDLVYCVFFVAAAFSDGWQAGKVEAAVASAGFQLLLCRSLFSWRLVGCPGLLGMFPTFLTISSNILASSNVKVFASSSPTLAK